MPKSSRLWLPLVFLLSGMSTAQVVGPAEIKDPQLKSLQIQYMDDLTQAGRDILALKFEFPFYLSNKLDLDLDAQQKSEQRGIQFNIFNGKTVLGISGNYYVAYSMDKVEKDQRAKETFLHVTLPILRVVVPRFQSDKDVKGYAVEVSHHVLTKVMGVSMESPEHFAVYLPQAAAIKLVAAKDETAQQSALLQAQTYINAEPVTIWLSGAGPQLAANAATDDKEENSGSAKVEATDADDTNPHNTISDEKTRKTFESMKGTAPIPKPAAPPRDLSPAALSALQTAKQPQIAELVKNVDPQAHFVSYSAPALVVFRQGIYLELSFTTNLPESAAGSRYKLAALAFDEHVSHLIRPSMAYFKDEKDFDGIGFSTSVHVAGKCCVNTSQAVEYYFPFSALQCYEKYDCTGQQLIDAGTVLVNGERVSLDLQSAESR